MAMGWIYLGLALISSATLLYEIVLTRLFAIAQGYHFGFLAISLALLGFGASGTTLALLNARERRLSAQQLPLLAALAAIALPGSYLAANYLPFDPYRIAWDPTQFGWLTLYLLALAVPFFIAGLVQGLTLMLWNERASPLYAANLVGSGLGCVVTLAALNVTSGPGSVLVGAVIAAGASLAFTMALHAAWYATGARRWLTLGFAAALLPGALWLLWQMPAWFELRLSPYKSLAQILNYPDARHVMQRANAFSRVDIIASNNIRSAPGLSLGFGGSLPRQIGIVIDADNVLAATAGEQISPALLDALPIALPFQLRPAAQVLILEPGGGLDVWVARHNGARSILALEKNELVAELIRQYGGDAYADPRVSVVIAEGRGYLARHAETFDVIDLALTENFRAVTAGAFTLSEDYAHTVEAFRTYLDHLAPRGLLVVQRWLQMPPTEELRVAALAMEALRANGAKDVSAQLVALRSFNTMLLLVKREPFEPREIEFVKTFAAARQFDLVYYPGIQPNEANRFHVLPRDVYYETLRELLAAPEALYARYEYDIAPPRDDHPFFFHFFKWAQLPTVLALLGKTWQPFGGSGYLILLGLFAVAFVLALALILLPLLLMPHESRADTRHVGGQALIYFAALGLGFLFVEIPLIQRFILWLDYPVYAFTVTLFGLLVSSGVGSLFANRIPWRGALLLLVATIGLYAWGLGQVTAWALRFDYPGRVLLALAVLAPLGFLMGIPFPRGVHALGRQRADWIPLAWGVNGFTSVLSSILATIIALSTGFSWVLISGLGMYVLAWVFIFPASTVQTPRP